MQRAVIGSSYGLSIQAKAIAKFAGTALPPAKTSSTALPRTPDEHAMESWLRRDQDRVIIRPEMSRSSPDSRKINFEARQGVVHFLELATPLGRLGRLRIGDQLSPVL